MNPTFLPFNTSRVRHSSARGGGVRGYSYNSLLRKISPERGTFTRLQVFKRVGILQVELYEICHLDIEQGN